MSLRRTVAVPFRESGREILAESEVVVSLSLDRDWYSPDQAKRLVDVAVAQNLVERTESGLVPSFDPSEVSVPDGFTPDEELLRQRSTFERALDLLTEAGIEKREAVAAINRLQQDLGVTLEAAAVIYARREGVRIAGVADRAACDI